MADIDYIDVSNSGTPAPTPTSAPVTKVRYEAENATISGGAQAFPADCPSCSNKNEVGDIGGSTGGVLVFNNVQTSAGTFTITIGYFKWYRVGKTRSC